MIAIYAIVSVMLQEFGFQLQVFLVFGDHHIGFIFPKLFAVAETDHRKTIFKIPGQGSDIVFLRMPEIIGGITGSLMLIGKNNKLAGVEFKRNANAGRTLFSFA